MGESQSGDECSSKNVLHVANVVDELEEDNFYNIALHGQNDGDIY